MRPRPRSSGPRVVVDDDHDPVLGPCRSSSRHPHQLDGMRKRPACFPARGRRRLDALERELRWQPMSSAVIPSRSNQRQHPERDDKMRPSAAMRGVHTRIYHRLVTTASKRPRSPRARCPARTAPRLLRPLRKYDRRTAGCRRLASRNCCPRAISSRSRGLPVGPLAPSP